MSDVREAIEALPDGSMTSSGGTPARLTGLISRAAVLAILDHSSEAAPTPHPFRYWESSEVAPVVGLDVEMLRRAIDNVNEMNPLDYLDDGDTVDAYAAEYARLTQENR